ncbi:MULTISPECIES: hypothetical protein [Bradyrhizobium]|uniref:hypothetical protein n=1 Tax=Bradyrhizobium TaxID=374 RepID=UPI0039C8B8B8
MSELKRTRPIGVIEGDQQTSNDAERVRAAGAPVVQVNTGREPPRCFNDRRGRRPLAAAHARYSLHRERR